MRLSRIASAGFAVATTLLTGSAPWATSQTGPPAPNIVMIVVDDMRFDEYGAGGHPYLETPNIDRLAARGASFSSAYHVTPLCSPNRASLVTGQYPSRHGILDNTSRSHASHRLDLFAKNLRQGGYVTAHIGKWHMGNDPTPRPGYDYWVSFAGQGKTYDPDLFEDGLMHRVEGYITDIFTERALGFLRSAQQGGRPFFLYLGHKAIHPEIQQKDDGSVDPSLGKEFIPARRHRGRYAGRLVGRRPSVNPSAQDLSSKPVIQQALAIRDELMERDAGWEKLIDLGVSDTTIQQRAEMMLAVDESVGRIVSTLAEMGALESTMIILTSDNGYFFGEHGLSIERRLPYEETLRSPLMIQYPRAIAAGLELDGLALSIDLAATILDAAGVEPPAHVQGRSLLPMLTGAAAKIRDVAYMEYYSHENPFEWTANLDYRIVRKGKYKYIRWIRFEDSAELYDLEADPFEQHNLIEDPGMLPVIRELRHELKEQIVLATGLAGE